MNEQEDAPGASDPQIRDETELGDADLVLRARSGDTRAFGELWRRHYRSGIVVARNVSPGTDADDLVQEAYTRIYQSIQRGRGPTGSFRAYLFTSIRNTAAGWGRARHETPMDELDAIEDPSTSEQATADSLDRGLTHQAFRSLPSRWQEVLWYSEIEGMKPAEIAPLLGMKATAVAQLTFRAREGLREAWIQAHLRSVADDSDCAWTIARLGAYERNNIGRRDRARLEAHIASCARCAIVASEAKEVSGRLTLVLIPLTVGVAGATGYLASVQGGGVPLVALAAMPSSVVQGAVSAGPGLGVASGTLASAASTAGSGSAAGSGAAAGAGVAGTAGAASTAGAAVGSAAAGAAATAGAAGVTVAAGGALTSVGVAGFAAATLVVAGTVVAAVALPLEADQQNPAAVRSVSDTGATDPADTTAGTATLAPEGPSPSDIPVLPAEDAAKADASGGNGAEHAAGGAANGPDANSGNGGAGGANAGNGSSGNGSTGNGNSGNGSTGNGNSGNGSTGNGSTSEGNTGNGNAGGGNGVTGENNGTPQSGNANSGAGNNNGAGPAELPAGSPTIASSSSSRSGDQTTIALVASGAPGAGVQVRIRGVVRATGTLGPGGQATLLVQPSAQDLAVDARLELRYVSGDAMGIPVSARLSALL